MHRACSVLPQANGKLYACCDFSGGSNISFLPEGHKLKTGGVSSLQVLTQGYRLAPEHVGVSQGPRMSFHHMKVGNLRAWQVVT